MNPKRRTNRSASAARRARFLLALGVLFWSLGRLSAVDLTDREKARGWHLVGPGPVAIEARIAVDAPSHTIYIASLGGGILKSTNGGATFAAKNDGLDGLGVSALAMWPHDPNLVYAGTDAGIYKTTDGGAHWNATTGDPSPLSMAIDPTNPSIVYAGYNGQLIKTIDGGDTWDLAVEGMGNPSVFSLTIDPNNPSVLYAGTTGEGGFKTTDGAATWIPLDIDTTVWSFELDPANSDIVYAGSNGNGVYKSADAGATFVRVGSPRVGVVLSLAKSGNRLYAGTATEGVSVSEDEGVTWRNTGVAQGLALVLSADSAGAVYLGTNFEGAFVRPAGSQPQFAADEKGSDGSHFEKEWRRLAWIELQDCNCQNGHALAIDPSDDRHVFFSTNDGGLLVTEDGGRTWQDGGSYGLLSRAPRGIAFDPQQPRRVYAGSFTGGGFYKSEDHGRHWQRRLFGSATVYVAGVTVDPVDHTIYVSTFRSDDGLWKSTDFGETFTRIDRSPGAPPDEFLGLSGRGIAVDPHNHKTVFHAGTTGVWRSQDAGTSWVNVEATSNTQVTVDPSDSSIVYATGQTGVFKSTDGGDSFSLKFEDLISRTAWVQIDPRHHNTLYVGTEGDGVFKSTDGGENWMPVNRSLDDPVVYGLALDLDNPNILYASTATSVYKTSTGGE
jgi:photosystem II stability/assembly factor-like uncharacterized protein